MERDGSITPLFRLQKKARSGEKTHTCARVSFMESYTHTVFKTSLALPRTGHIDIYIYIYKESADLAAS